jgi:type IV pilus assembly protein PilA
MKKHTTLKSKFNSAFSLVELLIVIAVIAIIAAIAIPNIQDIAGTAETSKDLRNAQFVVQTYNGYVDFVEGSGDTNLIAGLAPAATLADALTVLGANAGAGTEVTNVRLGRSMRFGIGDLDTADIAVDRITNTGTKLLLVE